MHNNVLARLPENFTQLTELSVLNLVNSPSPTPLRKVTAAHDA